MKKIRLDLSELKVESFVTSDGAAGAGGTVFGMDATNCDDTCNPGEYTCNGLGQCYQSDGCPWTLGAITCTIGPGPTELCTGDPCNGTDNTPDTCYTTCIQTQGPVGL
jgi:hypothetical protein